MRKVRIVMALSMLAFAFGPMAMADTMKPASKDVLWPADAIKWEDGPAKGIKVARLWGDWMKGGPYGVLVKFDAGLMHPLHKHTRSLRIVVLNGTFVHQTEGGSEVKLGPGSYLMQAAGQKHVSGCAPGTECQFFMASDNQFDMITDKAPGAEKKK